MPVDDLNPGVQGTLYFLHFDRPLHRTEKPHAQHYLGWTSGPVEERLARHRKGNGAAVIRALGHQGIEFIVVWTKPGTREEERRLKRSGHFKERLCVTCMLHNGRGVPSALFELCCRTSQGMQPGKSDSVSLSESDPRI